MMVADVGEPFDFGRHVGEFLELGGGQQPVGRCDLGRKRIGLCRVVRGIARPCFYS
jgi:hypothetical protein